MTNVIAQMWSLIGLFTLLRNILPAQLLQLFNQWWSSAQERFNPYCYLNIPQFYGNYGTSANEVYGDVELYLASLDAIAGARRLTVFRDKGSSMVEFYPVSDMKDSFNGAIMWWSHHVQPLVGSDGRIERKWFNLKLAKGSMRFLPAYFDYVANLADEFKKLHRGKTIFTNNGDARWNCVPFKHPSTFDSLALDPTLKNKIIRDLDWFRQGKELYRRVGRPWNRGYLLCGPRGTGKSSMVAAMANYMMYDVYDLELTKVSNTSELRALLMQTTDRSIIVIEDIDCSLALPNRLSQHDAGNAIFMNDEDRSRCRVILLGLLNFADRLWSCCGEERIIIFTSNYKHKIDPALLRTGGLEIHILLSYCTFPFFQYLAFNFLQIEYHPLFPLLEKTMKECGAEMAAAEISDILINHSDDPVKALNEVISALKEIQLALTSLSDFEEHKVTEERIPTSHYQEDGCQIAEEAHTQEVGGQNAQEAHTHEDAGKIAQEAHAHDDAGQIAEETHTRESVAEIMQEAHTHEVGDQIAHSREIVAEIMQEAHTQEVGDQIAHSRESVAETMQEAHTQEVEDQIAHSRESVAEIIQEAHTQEVGGQMVEEAHIQEVGDKIMHEAYTQDDAGQIKGEAHTEASGGQRVMETPTEEGGARSIKEANTQELLGNIITESHIQEVGVLNFQELAHIQDCGGQIAQVAHSFGGEMLGEAHAQDGAAQMENENGALSAGEAHTREDGGQILHEAHTQEIGDQIVKEEKTDGGGHIKQEAHTKEAGGQIMQEVHTQEVGHQIVEEAHTQYGGAEIAQEAHVGKNGGHIEKEAHSQSVGHQAGHTQDDGRQIAQEAHTRSIGAQKAREAYSQENGVESRRKKRRQKKPQGMTI